MLHWTPYAMVRITAFFTAGILLAIYRPLFEASVVATAAIVLTLIYFAFSSIRSAGFKKFTGLTGLFIIFIFGYLHLLMNTESNEPDHLLRIDGEVEAYTAFVRSVPEEKAKSWKVEIELSGAKVKQWKNVTGRVILYVSKVGGEVHWRYGDLILVAGAPQPLKPPANPGEFDFKRFLSFKNIYHQQYVEHDAVKWLRPTHRKGFVYYAHQDRFWASKQIQLYIKGNEEQAIANALVLGVTDGIDNDLQNAYAASGAMHVLAVSGLHVGILYAIILLLLKPISKYGWSRWTIAIISILCLWIFAFVTGLSPSVLRAVTMFSFVALARPLGWRTNIYNTLAASAFVLLLYNPYLIMSVGFQLSYLAVLGIVYGQGPIYRLIEVKSFLGDWVWKITCISLAAQLATFPLGLLYFHQFPTYFLVSNLFVIPLSTIVLILGILLLAVSSLGVLASLVGMATEVTIKLLNGVVFQTEHFPASLINGIYFTTFQCWVVMLIIFALVLLFESKSIAWLYSALFLGVVFSISTWLHFSNALTHSQFVVYAIQRHRAIEWMDKGHSFFYADSALLQDEERIKFHIRPNRIDHGIHTILESSPSARIGGMKVFYRQGKTWGILDQRMDSLHSIHLDYLIIGKNALKEFSSLRNQLKVKQVVLDGTNSPSYCKRLVQYSASQNIPIHSVLDQNAFIVTN